MFAHKVNGPASGSFAASARARRVRAPGWFCDDSFSSRRMRRIDSPLSSITTIGSANPVAGQSLYRPEGYRYLAAHRRRRTRSSPTPGFLTAIDAMAQNASASSAPLHADGLRLLLTPLSLSLL